jgi:hypothetical protein
MEGNEHLKTHHLSDKKSDNILPNFTPAKKDRKMQISSKLKFKGHKKTPLQKP